MADAFGKQVCVSFQGAPEPRVAIGLEPRPQRFQGVVERREVEAQNDVAMAVPRGSATYVCSLEEILEPFCPAAVVVVLQQRHPARLAETPAGGSGTRNGDPPSHAGSASCPHTERAPAASMRIRTNHRGLGGRSLPCGSTARSHIRLDAPYRDHHRSQVTRARSASPTSQVRAWNGYALPQP